VVISLIHGVGSIFVVPSTATVFSLGFMILVLLVRPQGLFGE